MTPDDSRDTVIEYWLRKSSEALESAESEYSAARYSFAVNRAYYACFYALSAVLLRHGRSYVKHSGVRAALHRRLIKTGTLEARWGQFYDRVFDYRQRGDYQELVVFEADQVRDLCTNASGFVEEMRRLLSVS
jgi:uncharacterized protein (UPF0332 family)